MKKLIQKALEKAVKNFDTYNLDIINGIANQKTLATKAQRLYLIDYIENA